MDILYLEDHLTIIQEALILNQRSFNPLSNILLNYLDLSN